MISQSTLAGFEERCELEEAPNREQKLSEILLRGPRLGVEWMEGWNLASEYLKIGVVK